MPDCSLNSDAIRIDCRGIKIGPPTVEIRWADQLYQFVLDDVLKRGASFHAGLFANMHVTDEAALSYPRHQRFAALLESPINACYEHLSLLEQRFDCIYTHQHHLIQKGAPYRELHFGTNWVSVWTDSDSDSVLKSQTEKVKHVSFMGSIQHTDSGAYSFRRSVAQHALERSDVDCFGKGIKEVGGKEEAIAPYRFSIAMENAASDFYFSEKLIDCLLVDTIPIYYGCDGIGKLFDQRGLLCFSTLDELEQILSRVNSELYDHLKPFALKNKEIAIRNGWHSHPSLFRRVAQSLPPGLGSWQPISITPPSVFHRAAKKLATMFSLNR
ncbi:glycosyltransferase family 10 domain-containing protein [Stieleria varia]|uniref:Glycosyltransferase family 10 (Fucosyltransferase) n=1 Tax=Stieleria varia TaxID=2528005 RepID=A0A5C6B3U8_9BACT|nr:glycosyltransferase family 10 [Stieleria varia]TWU05956.1 Glycosyltransferase family 10 (fucosyltransferase) [Stieleria varia]